MKSNGKKRKKKKSNRETMQPFELPASKMFAVIQFWLLNVKKGTICFVQRLWTQITRPKFDTFFKLLSGLDMPAI